MDSIITVGHYANKMKTVSIISSIIIDNLDDRLQRVRLLCYPPANLIRSFYWSSERHSELSPPQYTD